MKDIIIVLVRAFLLLAITVIALELALQAAFPRLPPALIEQMPQYQERIGHRLRTEHGAREFPAGEVVEYEVTKLSGDLYKLSCMTPADAQPIEPYRVSFKRDDHGFRNDEPWPDDVDLVVIGDSFTAAELIRQPFWRDLAASMLVLGVPGTGTLEQQRLFNAFALPRKPDTVVLAFFAGNDLYDTEKFAEMLRQGITRHERTHRGKNPLDYSVVFRLLQFLSETSQPSATEDCHYPVFARTEPPTPVAFYRKFLPLLGIDRESLKDSEMFQLTKKSIQEMAEAARSIDAELILMYIPQKAELYWSFLDDASKQTIITVESRDGGIAGLDKIDENLDVQRGLMRETAAELGVRFFDLTPPFAEAIDAGQSPFFFADTHWNQVGHNIARNALLDFLNRSNLES